MFDRLKLLIGDENLQLINKTKVLIVGVGGVGGECVLSLVRFACTFHQEVSARFVYGNDLCKKITKEYQYETSFFDSTIICNHPFFWMLGI